MRLYTLDDDGNPVPVDVDFSGRLGDEDLAKLNDWGRRKVEPGTHVGDDTVCGVRVSTVFLGMDMRMPIKPQGTPLVFETMMFGGRHRLLWDRYATRAEALDGHRQAVDRLTRDRPTLEEFAAWTDYP